MNVTARLIYGDLVKHLGRWHSVANVDRFGVWLISLEHKDAIPFLAFPVSVSAEGDQR